jgi:hypothetical protein
VFEQVSQGDFEVILQHAASSEYENESPLGACRGPIYKNIRIRC